MKTYYYHQHKVSKSILITSFLHLICMLSFQGTSRPISLKLQWITAAGHVGCVLKINFKSLLSAQAVAESYFSAVYLALLAGGVFGFSICRFPAKVCVLQIYRGKLADLSTKRFSLCNLVSLDALSIIRACFCYGLFVRQTANLPRKDEPRGSRRR